MEGQRLISARLLAFARALRRDQTTPENVLWSLLRNRRFCGLKFRRQHPLGPFITDFYCDEIRWAIELDGGQHNTAEVEAYDRRRTEYLQSRNATVTRLWNNQFVGETEAVVEHLFDVMRQLREGKHPHPSPLPEGEGEEDSGGV